MQVNGESLASNQGDLHPFPRETFLDALNPTVQSLGAGNVLVCFFVS